MYLKRVLDWSFGESWSWKWNREKFSYVRIFREIMAWPNQIVNYSVGLANSTKIDRKPEVSFANICEPGFQGFDHIRHKQIQTPLFIISICQTDVIVSRQKWWRSGRKKLRKLQNDVFFVLPPLCHYWKIASKMNIFVKREIWNEA